MYVCICNAVTDRQIRKAVTEGASSLRSLREQLSLGGCCGRCLPVARDIMSDCRDSQRSATTEPALQIA